MTGDHQLIYAGKILQGQHLAVVKKRLAAALKLDERRTEVLFSGERVIIKKGLDEQAAMAYQSLFQQAGAQLQVVRMPQMVSPSSQMSAQEQTPAPGDAFTLAEVGELLMPPTPAPQAPVDLNEINFDIANLGEPLQLPVHEEFPPAPEISHLALVTVGLNDQGDT